MGSIIAGGYRVPRHAPVKDQVYFQAIDLTGGSVRAQVRLTPEAGGTALIDLETVSTAGTQGFRFIVVDTTSQPYPISHFEMCIDKATLEATPQGAELGDDASFVWDVHFTPSGGIEQAAPPVPFIVAAGATR